MDISGASSTTTPVQDIGRICAKSFASALQQQDKSSSLASRLSDQSERLKIWAGDIGVFARGRASADYRLSQNLMVQDAIILPLKQLSSSLNTLATYTEFRHKPSAQAGETVDVSDTDESSSDSISDSSSGSSHQAPATILSTSEARLQAVADAIIDLYRLTALLRKQEQPSVSQRVETFSRKTLTTTDATELGDLASYTRWKIQQMFPATPQYLADRIVSATLFRRKRILYRRHHAEKLRSGVLEMFDAPIITSSRTPSIKFKTDEGPAQPTPAQAKSLQVEDKPKSVLSPTIASSINRLVVPAYPRSIALSGVSSGAAGRRKDLGLPPRPYFPASSREVICPYCSKVVKEAEVSGQRWSHHIMKDLDPYVCLEANCDATNALFNNIRDWTAHMQEHNAVWSCKATDHHPEIFHSATAFEEHMKQVHHDSVTEKQIVALKIQGRQPGPDPFVMLLNAALLDEALESPICPLCPCSLSRAQSEAPLATMHPTTDQADPKLYAVRSHIAAPFESTSLLALPALDHDEAEGSSDQPQGESREHDVDLPDANAPLSMDLLAEYSDYGSDKSGSDGGESDRSEVSSVRLRVRSEMIYTKLAAAAALREVNFLGDTIRDTDDIAWDYIYASSGSLRGRPYAGHEQDQNLWPFVEKLIRRSQTAQLKHDNSNPGLRDATEGYDIFGVETMSQSAQRKQLSATASTVFRIRALYDFQPAQREPEELHFYIRDIIYVVDRTYAEWWRGYLGGRTGIFPANHVGAIQDRTQQPELRLVRALFDYSPVEADEMHLRVGDMIAVSESKYKGWWKGSNRGQTGITPMNYVELLRDSTSDETAPDATTSMPPSPVSESSVAGPLPHYLHKDNFPEDHEALLAVTKRVQSALQEAAECRSQLSGVSRPSTAQVESFELEFTSLVAVGQEILSGLRWPRHRHYYSSCMELFERAEMTMKSVRYQVDLANKAKYDPDLSRQALETLINRCSQLRQLSHEIDVQTLALFPRSPDPHPAALTQLEMLPPRVAGPPPQSSTSLADGKQIPVTSAKTENSAPFIHEDVVDLASRLEHEVIQLRKKLDSLPSLSKTGLKSSEVKALQGLQGKFIAVLEHHMQATSASVFDITMPADVARGITAILSAAQRVLDDLSAELSRDPTLLRRMTSFMSKSQLLQLRHRMTLVHAALCMLLPVSKGESADLMIHTVYMPDLREVEYRVWVENRKNSATARSVKSRAQFVEWMTRVGSSIDHCFRAR